VRDVSGRDEPTVDEPVDDDVWDDDAWDPDGWDDPADADADAVADADADDAAPADPEPDDTAVGEVVVPDADADDASDAEAATADDAGAAAADDDGPGRMVRLRAGRPLVPIGEPEDLDLDEHKWATVVGIGALLILFLFASLAVGTAFRDGERRAEVPRASVPRLDGRTLEDAQRVLGPLGLLVAVDYEPNEVVPEGVVFGQRPVAGSSSRWAPR
jgi:hypothetical protein